MLSCRWAGRENPVVGVFKKQPLPGTYKTGETVPEDGVVHCTQYLGTRAKVKEGAKFGRCMNWDGRQHGMNCRWRYVDALEAIWVGRRFGYAPRRVAGEVELWAGWHLTLPSGCVAERHADGSWLAWDMAHVVDVHIARSDGKRTVLGGGVPPMLDREPNTSGPGWVGYTEDRSEADDDGPLHRLEVVAAADNTSMACSVAYREPVERSWAERLLSTINFAPQR
jgi:hypothetical protein